MIKILALSNAKKPNEFILIFEDNLFSISSVEKKFDEKIEFFMNNKSFIPFYRFKDRYLEKIKSSGKKITLTIEKDSLRKILKEITLKEILITNFSN